VFAVHPLNVHAVAWIPGRNDTLLCLFALAACNCLLHYIRSKDPFWLFMHIIWFVLALLTKETACLLPLLFGGMLLIKQQSVSPVAKKGMISCWILLAAVRLALQLHFIPHTPDSAHGTFARLPEFVSGMLMHLGKMLLPYGSSVFPMSQNSSLIPFVLVLAVAAWLAWKWGVTNRKIALLGLGWSVVFLLLPAWFGAGANPSVHYEHRAYFSLMGMLLFVSQIRFPAAPSAGRFSIALVIVLFAVLSFRRTSVYATELTFSLAGCEEAPDIAMFHDFAGFRLQQNNQPALAVNYYNEAIRLDSSQAEFYNHRGVTWHTLRQYRNAIADYTRVLRLKPLQKETYVSRSISYYSVGDYNAALTDLEHADSLGAAIDPKYIEALNKALTDRAARTAQ
jgi:hypothetical protein